MTTNAVRRYPRVIRHEAGDFEICYMTAADEAAMLAFAQALPDHDLLFLPRDITQPKVLAAWIQEIKRGALTTLLAVREGSVLGCATIVCDTLSWSAHVGEIRVVVAAQARGSGIGRLLIQEIFRVALGLGVEKLMAQMTADQRGAIAVFESMGFRSEALLRDHVRDREGVKHDLVILGHDVESDLAWSRNSYFNFLPPQGLRSAGGMKADRVSHRLFSLLSSEIPDA